MMKRLDMHFLQSTHDSIYYRVVINKRKYLKGVNASKRHNGNGEKGEMSIVVASCIQKESN